MTTYIFLYFFTYFISLSATHNQTNEREEMLFLNEHRYGACTSLRKLRPMETYRHLILSFHTKRPALLREQHHNPCSKTSESNFRLHREKNKIFATLRNSAPTMAHVSNLAWVNPMSSWTFSSLSSEKILVSPLLSAMRPTLKWTPLSITKRKSSGSCFGLT